MKNIIILLITLVFLGCSTKFNKKNIFEVETNFQNVKISSSADFFKITKNKTFTDEEIIIFFDSLIPDNLDLLRDICYDGESSCFSDSLINICSIYKIYILLCDGDFDSAKKQIENIQAAGVVHYQLDKFTSFYFWCLKKYEAANWNADFYLFRYHNEKRRTIKLSKSKIKFEIKFWNDSVFKHLKEYREW